MKPIKQEDFMGCGVACVAFILSTNYKKSLYLFLHGGIRAKTRGFFCKDIIHALSNGNLNYDYKYIKNTSIRRKMYQPNTIVYVKKSKRYPAGHYLCRVGHKWMDPWINFPDKDIQAGFRKRLPEKPVYVIFPEKPDKIVIQPLNKQKIIDWQDIWNRIYLSRSFKGKKQNLSEFIGKNREEH